MSRGRLRSQLIQLPRAQDHVVGRVVRRADLTAIMRECLHIRQGNQAEIADQPGAVEFVEIAGLDVRWAMSESRACLILSSTGRR